MKSEYLNCLILKELRLLPTNKAIKAKGLLKNLNPTFKLKAIVRRLVWLRKRGYVERLLFNNQWLCDDYVGSYWKITEQGRKFLLDLNVE